MYPSLLSSIRNDVDGKLAQQLNTRLESLVQRAQSLNETNTAFDARRAKSRSDLAERCELRNNYYRRKLPLTFGDVCSVRSGQKSFQLAAKQHDQSTQFYKKVLHIQSSSDIDQYQQPLHQSARILNELRTAVQQYEEEIDRSKRQLTDQTNQLNLYSDRLFQIQYEQQHLRSSIEQLKRQIRLEQELGHGLQSTFHPSDTADDQATRRSAQSSMAQFLQEYSYLCTEITEINVDIERKSIDLSSLQADLHVYQPILTAKANDLIASKTRPLLLPITIKPEEINHRSIVSVHPTQVHPRRQQLASESNNKSEWVKCKSRKSKPRHDA